LLKEVRQAGLSGEGPAWALRQRELAALVNNLSTSMKRERVLERWTGSQVGPSGHQRYV